MTRRTILLFYLFLFGLKADAQVFEEYLLSGWTMKASSSSNTLPAEVPGSVQYNLLLNGKQIDASINERWSFASTFQADRQILSRSFIHLLFEGLDSHAEVYLNGELILKADNMFRSWSVPVKSFLQEGDNELRIDFVQSDNLLSQKSIAAAIDSMKSEQVLAESADFFIASRFLATKVIRRKSYNYYFVCIFL